MKNRIIFVLLSLASITGFGLNLHAQSGPTVTITSPDPTASATVITEDQQTTGIQLVACATGTCPTFVWTDQYGGNWGTGTLSPDGMTSTLTYFPPGYNYGAQVPMTVTVTDSNNVQSPPKTVNLIVPMLITGDDVADLSYYDGTAYVPNDPSNTGAEQTALRVKIVPDPNATGMTSSYLVWPAGGCINASFETDPEFIQVTSLSGSSRAGDQDLQLETNDGIVADLALTVHRPNSATVNPSVTYVGLVDRILGYKGWECHYTWILKDYSTIPVPNATPMNEAFDSITGSWSYYLSTSTRGLEGTYGGTGIFDDKYYITPSAAYTPQPVYDTDPGANTSTGTETQEYWAGGFTDGYSPGVGVNVKNHTVNWYRGSATP